MIYECMYVCMVRRERRRYKTHDVINPLWALRKLEKT